MRPIPATSLGDAHGLLRAIEKRGRLRTDEFVTEFSVDELFPAGLDNALGRRRPRAPVRALVTAGRVAAAAATREAHDGLDLPRPRDRAQPARVLPAGPARVDARLRPLDGV